MAACGDDEERRAQRGQECGVLEDYSRVECEDGLKCISYGAPASNYAEKCIETRTVNAGEACTGPIEGLQPNPRDDLVELLCPQGLECSGNPSVCN